MIRIRNHKSMMKAFLVSALFLIPSLNGMTAELAVEETPIIVRLLRNGSTPLHIAAYFDRVEEIEQLLEGGAQEAQAKDNDGATALHIAAKKGNIRAVQSLIAHVKRESERAGVRFVHARDKSLFSPLYYATLEGKLEVIQCLFENGVCLETEGYMKPKSPLDVAAENGDLPSC